MQEQANHIGRASNDWIVAPQTGPPHILVVDDEPDACEALRLQLEGKGYRAMSETSAYGALEKIATQDFDLVLTDVTMVEMNGLDLCQRIVETRPEMPVILVTGRGRMSTVVEALRIGARDFLTKPIDAGALLASVANALRHRTQPDASLQQPKRGTGPGSELMLTGLLGQSAAIQQVYKLIADLSGSVASVLLQGETGTGKEVIAHAIHANSRFRNGPFVAINCAAVPAGLLESELFGHARGAFTDAKTATKGLLVQANGGTLLLDEISELPLEMQPKLLRALQERTVRPVGERQEVPFDCRIIAATNRDLEAEVSAKRFREDLYYRIDVVRMTVPPLRERGDDILLLAQHFLGRLAKGSRRNTALTAPVAEKLLGYAWPGNVRELENCIERAVELTRFEQLAVEDLPDKIRYSEPTHDELPTTHAAADMVSLAELERRHVLRAMKLFDGNRTLAAKLLGIDRCTLYRRLLRYAETGSD